MGVQELSNAMMASIKNPGFEIIVVAEMVMNVLLTVN